MINDQQQTDIKYIGAALDLAQKGVGLVSPNPLVGCVIVDDGGNVVGEGTYEREGVTHAEIIALQKAGERARGATAYVSLEPHAHHGKTPPCTDALVNAGIKRVVAPIEDPNPLVSGKGFAQLRERGVEVTTGVLAEEAAKINEKFICWHRRHRPFVHLKLATSMDGRLAIDASVSTLLSGPKAIERVHELRHEHDAILIGGNTAVVDDPSLTDRSGRERLRPLTRVILDNRLRLPAESKLATTAREIPTLVYSNCLDLESVDRLSDLGVVVVPIERGARNLRGVLADLCAREVQSVLVEGGSAVAGAFLDARLVDKVTMILSPVLIGGPTAPVAVGGKGAAALGDILRLEGVTCTEHGTDIEITGYPQDIA